MVKENINEQLVRENKNQAVREWLEERQAETDIQVYDDVIWSTIDKDLYASAGSAQGNP